MKTAINLNEWSRKEHFNFFNKFDEPFFGVCIEIDCTIAYQKCKQTGQGFFLYYLYQCLAAANQVEAFRLRIEDEEVFLYDVVNASAVINREDHTFGFSSIDFFPDFKYFTQEAKIEIERIRNSSGLTTTGFGNNVLHISAMPWLKFTSIAHARSFAFQDSCPKVSFGQMSLINGKQMMPVSVHVNHALMDGYHVSLFVNTFQELMNQL